MAEGKLENCPWCGCPNLSVDPSRRHCVTCELTGCQAEGPVDDPDGSKWNAVAKIVREHKEQNAQQAGGVGG